MTAAPDRLPPGGNPTRKNARIKRDGASWLGIAVAGYILIFFTFGVLGLWAAVAKIDRAVAAPGVVSIETNRKTVEHFEGGMVREILVKEGQAVEKGAILFRLENIEAKASFETLQHELDAFLAVEARLMAERDQKTEITWPRDLVQRSDEVDDVPDMPVVHGSIREFRGIGQIQCPMGALERDRVRFAPFADGFDAVRDRGALGYAAVVDNLEAAIMDCGVSGRAAPDIFPAAVKNGCAGGRAAILDKFQTAVMNVRVGGLAAADNFPPAVVDRCSVDFAVDDMDDPAVIDRGSDRFAIDKFAAAGVHCRFDVPPAGEDKLEAAVMDRRAVNLRPREDAFYAPVVDACVEGLARGVDVQMIAGVQDEVVLCRGEAV